MGMVETFYNLVETLIFGIFKTIFHCFRFIELLVIVVDYTIHIVQALFFMNKFLVQSVIAFVLRCWINFIDIYKKFLLLFTYLSSVLSSWILFLMSIPNLLWSFACGGADLIVSIPDIVVRNILSQIVRPLETTSYEGYRQFKTFLFSCYPLSIINNSNKVIEKEAIFLEDTNLAFKTASVFEYLLQKVVDFAAYSGSYLLFVLMTILENCFNILYVIHIFILNYSTILFTYLYGCTSHIAGLLYVLATYVCIGANWLATSITSISLTGVWCWIMLTVLIVYMLYPQQIHQSCRLLKKTIHYLKLCILSLRSHANHQHNQPRDGERLHEKKRQEAAEANLCVVCQDNNKNIVVLPCRHLCVCNICIVSLLTVRFNQRKCPLCREQIHDHLLVYT